MTNTKGAMIKETTIERWNGIIVTVMIRESGDSRLPFAIEVYRDDSNMTSMKEAPFYTTGALGIVGKASTIELATKRFNQLVTIYSRSYADEVKEGRKQYRKAHSFR